MHSDLIRTVCQDALEGDIDLSCSQLDQAVVDLVAGIGDTTKAITSCLYIMAKKAELEHKEALKGFEDITHYYPVVKLNPEKNSLSISWRESMLYRNESGQLRARGKHIAAGERGYTKKKFPKASPEELELIMETERRFSSIRELQTSMQKVKKSIFIRTEQLTERRIPEKSISELASEA